MVRREWRREEQAHEAAEKVRVCPRNRVEVINTMTSRRIK